jgi:KTSC domain
MTKDRELAPIESSMFTHHAYDPNTRTMSLRFKSGALYEADDVPIEKNEAFLGSASKGRYFNDKLKDRHLWRKVRE